MKFIIPIQGIVIEKVIKLGDTILIPAHYMNDGEKVFEFEEDDLYEEVCNVIRFCHDAYYKVYCGYTVAIIEHPYSIENFQFTIPDEEFIFMEELCYKVDRVLDYFRIAYCNFSFKENLPGIPGIIDTFRRGIIIDVEREVSRELLGKVYQIYTKPGIGLDIDYILYDEDLYSKVFFVDRNDEVYLKCRYALTRINEALYMNNDNASFIYLMTTLEMLADDEFIKFKDVKKFILAFVAANKKEYKLKSDKFLYISKNIRTEVVHNGKSLYEILGSYKEIGKLLNFLMSTIVVYCEEVIKTNITTIEDLMIERKDRISKLA